MFTRRLDTSGGDVMSLSPGEQSLFIDMVPSLRIVATGKMLPVESDEDVVMDSAPGRSAECPEKEVSINRQTALLCLNILARVMGRRHQVVFAGVLDDVTEIVARDGSSALPG